MESRIENAMEPTVEVSPISARARRVLEMFKRTCSCGRGGIVFITGESGALRGFCAACRDARPATGPSAELELLALLLALDALEV